MGEGDLKSISKKKEIDIFVLITFAKVSLLSKILNKSETTSRVYLKRLKQYLLRVGLNQKI